MQNLNDIVEAIIKMPYEFYSKNNISLYGLFEKTRYIEYHDRINERDIKRGLLKNKNHMEYWYDYSADKRVGAGYYLSKNKMFYEVGFLDKGQINKIKKYIFSINACADFIKIEMEYLRRLGPENVSRKRRGYERI